MTIHALATGVLWKSPEQRTAKSGNPFTTATVRGKDGDATQWVKVLAFSETAQTELMRLCDGDAVSLQGSLSAEIYQPAGRDARISLTIFFDAILPLRRPKPAKGMT
jgi:single-stranded DNA-binding protein